LVIIHLFIKVPRPGYSEGIFTFIFFSCFSGCALNGQFCTFFGSFEINMPYAHSSAAIANHKNHVECTSVGLAGCILQCKTSVSS